MKIGQQMLKFQRELNVQTGILSLRIFIFSVMSIKISLIMHNWYICMCTNKRLNFEAMLTHLLEKNIAKF